jgi:rubrerythrin
MEMKLGALEMMTVAETIERDSVDFYRKAARRFNDDQLRKMLLLLAEWERKHEGVFLAMKKEFMQTQEEHMTFDISSFVLSNPLALKSLAWSATQSKSKQEFTGDESKEEILELAMSRERNAVSFYYDLVGRMQDPVGKSKIHDLIEEEKRHIGILRKSLEQLRDPYSRACSS